MNDTVDEFFGRWALPTIKGSLGGAHLSNRIRGISCHKLSPFPAILHQIKLSCQIPSVVEGILTRKIIARAEEAGIKSGRTSAGSRQLAVNEQSQSADTTWSWLQKHNLS